MQKKSIEKDAEYMDHQALAWPRCQCSHGRLMHVQQRKACRVPECGCQKWDPMQRAIYG